MSAADLPARSARESRPVHQFSPGAQRSGFSPVSTLMPGMMPFELSTSTNGLPALRGSNALN